MRNGELSRQILRIDELFRRVRSACGTDLLLQGEWARYLCVVVAGLLENSVEELYGDFVRRNAAKPVSDFTSQALSYVQNPKASRFVELASAFRSEWGEDLKVYLDEEGRRDALDSIMNNRHLIAHGSNTGVSIARVDQYYRRALQVLAYIEQQLAPSEMPGT